MGTTLRNLVTRHQGKMPTGRPLEEQASLTLYKITMAMPLGSVDSIVTAVPVTLLHVNSSDASLRHHLCTIGEKSWCKYKVAKAKNEPYHHDSDPIPEAIL